jgi:hypothetical protein
MESCESVVMDAGSSLVGVIAAAHSGHCLVRKNYAEFASGSGGTPAVPWPERAQRDRQIQGKGESRSDTMLSEDPENNRCLEMPCEQEGTRPWKSRRNLECILEQEHFILSAIDRRAERGDPEN